MFNVSWGETNYVKQYVILFGQHTIRPGNLLRFKGYNRAYRFKFVSINTVTGEEKIVCIDGKGRNYCFDTHALRGPVVKRSYKFGKEVA